MCDVVGAVVELLCTVTASFSEHIRVGKRSASGRDMDGSSAGKVKATHFEHPSRRIPGPACNGVVDDGRPDEHIDDAGEHPASFGDGAYGKRDAAYCQPHTFS